GRARAGRRPRGRLLVAANHPRPRAPPAGPTTRSGPALPDGRCAGPPGWPTARLAGGDLPGAGRAGPRPRAVRRATADRPGLGGAARPPAAGTLATIHASRSEAAMTAVTPPSAGAHRLALRRPQSLKRT